MLQNGNYPNCPCNMPYKEIITFASEQELKAVDTFLRLFQVIEVPKPMPTPTPTPTPQPEAPKEPTKALGILADTKNYPNGIAGLAEWAQVHWNFFATDYRKEVGCRWDPAHWEKRPFDRNAKEPTRTYPGGEWPLTLFNEKCTYKNSGDNPGKLFCGDKAINCFWDPPQKDPAIYKPGDWFGNYTCNPGWTRQTVFTCPW